VDMLLFLNNKAFAFSNLAALINYCATFAVTFLLSLYLQQIKMLTPSQTGSILVAAPVVQALLSPVAGKLSDRFEPQFISSTGMVLTVIGLVLLIFSIATQALNMFFLSYFTGYRLRTFFFTER